MFIVIWSSSISLSASGIGYRRYHFFLRECLLSSPFTDAEGDWLSTICLCDACRERKLPFADAGEDWRSVTAIFRVIFFHLLIPSDAEFGRIG
jgi:hypothetical protein